MSILSRSRCATPQALCRLVVVASLGSIGLSVACVDGGGPTKVTPIPADSVQYHALLDGVAWQPFSLQVYANNSGGFRLFGQSILTLSPVSIQLSVSHVTGPGSYVLGVNESRVTGGSGFLMSGTATWSTGTSGDAGVANITTITPTRIAGTFSFNAPPTGAFGGTRIVTQGAFDFPIGSSGISISDANAGGTLAGSVNGAAYNAADMSQYTDSFNNSLHFSASNSNYAMDVVISDFTGPGIYVLGTGTQRTLIVRRGTAPFEQWGGSGANVGTITINTVTSSISSTVSKSTGTLSATLQPSGSPPGTGPLTVNATWVLR